MSVDEREKKEEEEFKSGPLSVLTTSVKTNSQVHRLNVQSQYHPTSLGMPGHGTCCYQRQVYERSVTKLLSQCCGSVKANSLACNSQAKLRMLPVVGLMVLL